MNTPLAVLPMYDRPELRAETDRLWGAIRDRLRDAGVSAPSTLDREMPVWDAWTSPDLVLGQTCGLPYATRLADRVTLLGAPDFGVEDCPPGHYCSVLVVREDDAREDLAAFEGAVAAVNETGSQSGHAALIGATLPFARNGRFLGGVLMTGSHDASIGAVAAGEADIAAIDAVTWRLARRYDDAPRRLRELARTRPVPGLPYITALGRDADTISRAVESAIAGLDRPTLEALGLRGFVRFQPSEYAPLATAFAEARRLNPLPEPG